MAATGGYQKSYELLLHILHNYGTFQNNDETFQKFMFKK
jgi:hypothetical protein